MAVRALVLAGALLALVGCTGATGDRPAELASLQPQDNVAGMSNSPLTSSVPLANAALLSVQPASPPEPLPQKGCHTYATVFLQILNPPAQRIEGMDDVFTGEIVEIGDAQWNTTDSAAPTTDLDPTADYVFRLVRVKVATSVKGEANGELVVAIEGGKIGCNTFESALGRRDLKVGQTFLWLARNEGLRARVAAVPVVHEIWDVDGDGNVAAPMARDGHLEVMSLEQAVRTTS